MRFFSRTSRDRGNSRDSIAVISMMPDRRSLGLVVLLTSAMILSLPAPASAQSAEREGETGQAETLEPAAATPPQGLKFEPATSDQSGGFLHNLNELFAPKEVLLDIGRLGSSDLKQDVFVLAGSVGLTAAAVDDGDDVFFNLGPEALDDVSDSMSLLGSRSFMYPALVSTFFVGKAVDRPGVSRTAAQMTQALLLTDMLVVPIKVAVGRTRPDGSNNHSFPSGHTAGAFAIATVLQHNHGLKVGLPAYALASLMGMSRIDQRKHFLSDVVAGAAIGYFAAGAVNKRFPGQRLNLHIVRGPAGGRGLGFTLEF